MKILGCEFWYILKDTVISRLWPVLITIFSILGFLYSLSDALNMLFELPFGLSFLRDHIGSVLITACILSMILNHKPLHHSCFIQGTDIKITLKVCDIFHVKGALIIPTNTTFDTTMDDEFISVASVQGQYQNKYFPQALTKLDREITSALNEIPYTLVKDNRRTNTKRYPIGTTSRLSRGQQHDYFLAIADINKYGVPVGVSYQTITQSLVALWEYLNSNGNLETIRIPIVGTGRAGLKDASRDQIIQEIIFSFVSASQEMKVSEHLIICIHPSDFINKNLHWDALCEYLEYTCKFQSQHSNTCTGNAEPSFLPIR